MYTFTYSNKQKDEFEEVNRMFRTKSKKWIACLLVVVISALMLPVSVFAAEYDQGIDVTADDYTDRQGYKWDSATNTLTLTNVTLIGDGTGKGILLPQGEVTIVLEGENIIQGFSEGVAQKNNNSSKDNLLQITGSGSLTVSQCNFMSSGSFENVTVDGAKLVGNNTNGLVMNGNFVAKNGAYIDLSVADGDSNAWNPIYANGNIEIYDSTLISHSGATGGIWTVGVGKDSSLLKFVNSNITLNDSGWGAQSGSVQNPNGSVYIENSTITVNSAAGVFANNSAEVVGNVKFITENNKQILRTNTGEITLNLGEQADFQGYINAKGTEVTFPTDYILAENWEIAAGRTLTIPEGVTLTLSDGVNITKAEGSQIINHGTILVPCDALNAVEVDGGNAPAKHHSFNNYISNHDATCSQDGTETSVCDNCDVTDTRVATGSALGHNYNEVWSNDAGQHWHECTICHEKKDIADHSFAWIVDKEATETEAGSKHEECTVCGFAKAAVEIPLTGTTETTGSNTSTGNENINSSGDAVSPQTGDNSILGVCLVLLVSAGGLALTAIVTKKRKVQ